MTGILLRPFGRGGTAATCLMPTDSPPSPPRRSNLRAAAVRARSPPPAPFGSRGSGGAAEGSSSAAAGPPPFVRSFYKYNCWSQEAEQMSREVAAASGSSRPPSPAARGRTARAAGATALSAQAASPAFSQLDGSSHLRVRVERSGGQCMWVAWRACGTSSALGRCCELPASTSVAPPSRSAPLHAVLSPAAPHQKP